MAQYDAPEEWPDWAKVSRNVQNMIEAIFLGSLSRFSASSGNPTAVDEVDSIRMHRLTHYKCHTDWNHEFVRGDFTYHGTPLIVVWERDLKLTTPRNENKPGFRTKSGVSCRALDRVALISEADFQDFVGIKDAYKLRTAELPAPGLDFLQVVAVLETHSVRFPMHHLYATMCYWYADSTFEVLAELGKAEVHTDPAAGRKGTWFFGRVEEPAYNGVTRKGMSTAGEADETDTADEADTAGTTSYEMKVVEVQQKLIEKYDTAYKKTLTRDEIDKLERDLGLDRGQDQDQTRSPAEVEADHESLAANGWNVAQFLRMIQDMPTHEVLRDASVERAAEVRAQLVN